MTLGIWEQNKMYVKRSTVFFEGKNCECEKPIMFLIETLISVMRMKKWIV